MEGQALVDFYLGLPEYEFAFEDVRLDEEKVGRYLEGLSGPRREEAARVIESTRAVRSQDCADRIAEQVVRCMDALGTQPFYVHQTASKIGSENLFMYLMRDLLRRPNFAGFFTDTKYRALPQMRALPTAKELRARVPLSETLHFVRIDDCVYSGIQMYGIIDEATYPDPRLDGWRTRLQDSNVTWHTCVGFCSDKARDWLNAEFNASQHRWNLYASEIVASVELPSRPWKMYPDYTEEDAYRATPIFFSHKVAADYRTSFSQIYLEGYNPDTGEQSGMLVSSRPDRRAFDFLASLF